MKWDEALVDIASVPGMRLGRSRSGRLSMKQPSLVAALYRMYSISEASSIQTNQSQPISEGDYLNLIKEEKRCD